MSKHTNSNGFIGDDDRLRKQSVADVRAGRDSANISRTLSDGTAFTLDERRKMLRNEFVQQVLPNPPAIPGYHLCWLSTNSKVDPIHNRMRLGYEPVKASEVHGMEKFSMKDGEFYGFVSCNEMVLFKIAEDIYQMMMTEYHHNMPLEYEQGMREQIDAQNNQHDNTGRKLGHIDGDGFIDLGKTTHAPIFS